MLRITIFKAKHDYEGSGSNSYKLNLLQLSMIMWSLSISFSPLRNTNRVEIFLVCEGYLSGYVFYKI